MVNKCLLICLIVWQFLGIFSLPTYDVQFSSSNGEINRVKRQFIYNNYKMPNGYVQTLELNDGDDKNCRVTMGNHNVVEFKFVGSSTKYGERCEIFMGEKNSIKFNKPPSGYIKLVGLARNTINNERITIGKHKYYSSGELTLDLSA